MKSILILAATLTLAACGAAPQSQSDVNGFPGFNPRPEPKPLTDDFVVFGRDLRPVDGDLIAVSLERSVDGTYAISVHTNFYDRLNGKEVDATNEIGQGFSCTLASDTYTCSIDNRPVDGALQVVTIASANDGTYTATYTTSVVDRTTGETHGVQKELGSDLKKVQPIHE